MFGSAYSRFARIIEMSRSRKALLQLSDRQLRDIGITREEALREANRAAWF